MSSTRLRLITEPDLPVFVLQLLHTVSARSSRLTGLPKDRKSDGTVRVCTRDPAVLFEEREEWLQDNRLAMRRCLHSEIIRRSSRSSRRKDNTVGLQESVIPWGLTIRHDNLP
jgi:hypothetical protein